MQLHCWCREQGKCDCELDKNDPYHFCTDLGTICLCTEDVTDPRLIGFGVEPCQCVMFPATQGATGYLTNTHDVLRRRAR